MRNVGYIFLRMKKKDLLITLLILAALLIVFFDVFTLKNAFLSGDHRDQQYPWAKFYQHEIQAGRLPWWTSQIHCGFPLLAEGQIGAFYPLNFFFFYFLPMKFAYNYIVLFQYFLGGLLFYLYLIRHGVSRWGGFFACLIFLFGSTQGGYFYYNYISQKVVIWLPLTLILIDRLFERCKSADAFWLAGVFAVQIFGGYLQVAIYSIFFSTVYFLWSLAVAKRRAMPLILYAGAGMLGFFFSLVQLLPTLELARLSSRADAQAGLAYVGSMLPVGFFTLLFPAWDGFLGSEWYLGVAGLFFMIVALVARKRNTERFFIFSAGLFLLLALGKYSPLYRAIVEGTGFQGFRTPIKFLFFVTFSCAVLAGFGFDRFFDPAASQNLKDQVVKKFSQAALLFLIFPLAATEILLGFREKLLPAFQNLVVGEFFGKAGHPHSSENYSARAAQFYDSVIGILSLSHQQTWISWALLALFPVVLFMVLKMKSPSRAKMAVTVFLFIDLILYGLTSIRPNLEPYSTLGSGVQSKIVKALGAQPSPFRVSVVSGSSADILNLPFYPNRNMLYGIDDLGAYSPLVMKTYRDFLNSWGYVNDSLSAALPFSSPVLAHLKELSLLNVHYLVSRGLLDSPILEPVLSENGNELYRIKNALPRVFFTPRRDFETPLSGWNLEGIQAAEMSVGNPQRIEILADAPQEGMVFLSEVNYPGWKATLDGEEVPIRIAGQLFRAIEIPRGRHQIVMRYEPVLYNHLGLAALGVFILGCGLLAFQAMFRWQDRVPS